MTTSSASLDRSPRSNWVQDAGGLPPYVRKIARAIHEKRGIPLSQAIAYAIGRLKKWAAGGDGVSAETRAKAAAAIAAWERLKAKSGKLTEADALGGVCVLDDNLGVPSALLLEWLNDAPLVEASLRRAIRRLPDGTFAPKGSGSILSAGDRVDVPHRSGRGTVTGTVVHRDSRGARVRLDDGPDAGAEIAVKPASKPTKRYTSELYRDSVGHEVWRIRDPQGKVIQSGIASDHDMKANLDEHNAKRPVRDSSAGSGKSFAEGVSAAYNANAANARRNEGAAHERERAVSKSQKGGPPVGSLDRTRGIFRKYDDDGLRVALRDPELKGANRRQAEREARSRGITVEPAAYTPAQRALLDDFGIDPKVGKGKPVRVIRRSDAYSEVAERGSPTPTPDISDERLTSQLDRGAKVKHVVVSDERWANRERNRAGASAARELRDAQSAATRLNLNPRSTTAEKRAAKERVDRALAADRASRAPAAAAAPTNAKGFVPGDTLVPTRHFSVAGGRLIAGQSYKVVQVVGTDQVIVDSGGKKLEVPTGSSAPVRRRAATRAQRIASGQLKLTEAGPPKRVDLLLKSGRTVNVSVEHARRLHAQGKANADQRPGAAGGDFENKHPRGGRGTTAGGKFVKKGSSGTEVRAVQRRVGARVDGEFGDKTTEAVKRFQRAHGLTVDGVVGRQTVAALRGRRDAKRVGTGALSKRDREYLAGHIRGTGRPRRRTGDEMTGKQVTSLVEAVAPEHLVDRVASLEPGELARLADGCAVKHHMSADGRELWTSGRPYGSGSEIGWRESRRTPEAAVADALTASAGETDPLSLGGTVRFGSYTRVTVNGTPARFVGVTHTGQPLVRYDGHVEATQVAWPELAPAPRPDQL